MISQTAPHTRGRFRFFNIGHGAVLRCFVPSCSSFARQLTNRMWRQAASTMQNSLRNTYLVNVLALVGIGVIMVFSSSAISVNPGAEADAFVFIKRHLIFLGLGLGAMTVLARMDYHTLARFATPIYLLGLVLLAVAPAWRGCSARPWPRTAASSSTPTTRRASPASASCRAAARMPTG